MTLIAKMNIIAVDTESSERTKSLVNGSGTWVITRVDQYNVNGIEIQ